MFYWVLEVPRATAIGSPVTSAEGTEKYAVVFMSTTFANLIPESLPKINRYKVASYAKSRELCSAVQATQP